MKNAAGILSRLAPLLMALCLACAAGHALPNGALQTADLGRCELDSGKFIQPCLLSYRTYGRLNVSRTNAVFFPSWYNGRSEDLAQFFGPDKIVDTTRYFGVAIDALGDGVSSSASNSTTQHGAAFPSAAKSAAMSGGSASSSAAPR